jgi:hypothetical protein
VPNRCRGLCLLDRGFQRLEDFNLCGYAAQSFGVFQEKPFDVVLRFVPETAEDAARWQFHPTQSTVRETDESLVPSRLVAATGTAGWARFLPAAILNITERLAHKLINN